MKFAFNPGTCASCSAATSQEQDVHKKFKFDERNGPAMALTFIVSAPSSSHS